MTKAQLLKWLKSEGELHLHEHGATGNRLQGWRLVGNVNGVGRPMEMCGTKRCLRIPLNEGGR